MRSAMVLMLILLISSAALAEEVEFELVSSDADNPLDSVSNTKIRFKNIRKPPGTTHPEGELAWGRLTLGKHKYLTCTVIENKNLTRLYLDRDMDKNLAEETPVAAKGNVQFPMFVVEGIEGEFEIGGSLLSVTMTVWIIPSGSGWVPVCTAYVGKMKVEGEDFIALWVPGEQPRIGRGLRGARASVLYFGKKELSINKKDVALRDGKVVATYNIIEKENLVSEEAPKGLKYVSLFKKRSSMICMPDKDKVFFPRGWYMYGSAVFERESEGVRYTLDVVLSGRKFRTGKKTLLGKLEPLTIGLRVKQKGGEVSIQAFFTDASNRKVFLSKDGEAVDGPKLTVRDPDGNVVATYKFKPG